MCQRFYHSNALHSCEVCVCVFVGGVGGGTKIKKYQRLVCKREKVWGPLSGPCLVCSQSLSLNICLTFY